MVNVFSIPVFFVVFRESLESAIIISVLLGIAKRIANTQSGKGSPLATEDVAKPEKKKQNIESGLPEAPPSPPSCDDASSDQGKRRNLLRKLRLQILIGSTVGLLAAVTIGAAFIAVWFTRTSDLWTNLEELWEGIFSLIASVLIFIVGITMPDMLKTGARWRVKLQEAFEGKDVDVRTEVGKWILLFLPLITVLREGVEAVISVGDVSIGQPATSIPLAAIVGIICGVLIGYIIYAFACRTSLIISVIVTTNLILLVGAGLFSKSIEGFQDYMFNKLLGVEVDDAGGTGPGSYDVRGNVWHLNCCSPETGQGWTIFAAIFGWSNNGSLGTILGYLFYWFAVIVALFALKRRENKARA
ncbi:iron permease FTR1 [Thelephora terrestris]|uniref:Iron permease FTR1 n=1 Tax=Thelephora terrestris TaxID=56493 RepID=A0A9P6HLD8_9AGAM|nr:iron permease FTR1 [Thelephora terrestris]